MNYYRLKQVDLDGTYTYSGIQTATLNIKENSFQVYPNPTQQNLTIRFDQAVTGAIMIVNIFGQEVFTETLNNETQLDLNLADLPAGTYQLLVNGENKSHAKRFVKVN